MLLIAACAPPKRRLQTALAEGSIRGSPRSDVCMEGEAAPRSTARPLPTGPAALSRALRTLDQSLVSGQKVTCWKLLRAHEPHHDLSPSAAP